MGDLAFALELGGFMATVAVFGAGLKYSIASISTKMDANAKAATQEHEAMLAGQQALLKSIEESNRSQHLVMTESHELLRNAAKENRSANDEMRKELINYIAHKERDHSEAHRRMETQLGKMDVRMGGRGSDDG